MPSSEHPQTLPQQEPAAARLGGPTFSVVIASSGARSWLSVCLPRLIEPSVRAGTEVIVARADTPGAMSPLSRAYPLARFVWAPPRATTSELRRAGLAAASGDVVALVDDSDDRVVPDERWLEGLKWRRSVGTGEPLLNAAVTQTAGPSPRVETVRFLPYTASPVPDRTRHPYLSVVVPVQQGGDDLRHALEALTSSDLPRSEWELIVVDDASRDDTALVAADYADVLVRLPGAPRGPAYARNRGFEFARGEYTAFIDPDVCVHRDALGRFVLVLSREPEVTAVFGSFDANPAARGFVSQYRNLLAHRYHQEYRGPAETFWASCGAIRSSAFAEAGMFDEWRFSRPQVEDFELGFQLRERGHRVVLRPEIQATTMKRWSLDAMVVADFQDRSVPWMRIFPKRGATMRRRATPLRTVKRINTALTWLAVAFTLGAAIAARPSLLVAAVLCVLLVVINGRAQHRFFTRERGTWFALRVIPLELLSYLANGMAVTVGWLLRQLLGDPTPNPTVEAFSEVGVKMWPPVPAKRPRPAARS
jgi:Glycosyl transferase family 2